MNSKPIMSSNNIVLMSSDGESFTIDESVAREFQFVANMMEEISVGQPIPIPNVTGKILAMVIEYCKKRIEITSTEEPEDEKKKKFETWDAEFIKLYFDSIREVMIAAYFLTVESLLDLTCQTTADSIKDKTVEELREFFQQENDYTPEEEAAVYGEYPWVFE